MKHLTAQQLAIAACGALIVAGAMLSRDNRLGYVLLAVAALCGIGAFFKARRG